VLVCKHSLLVALAVMWIPRVVTIRGSSRPDLASLTHASDTLTRACHVMDATSAGGEEALLPRTFSGIDAREEAEVVDDEEEDEEEDEEPQGGEIPEGHHSPQVRVRV
jgi:hypothetical protein